MKKIIPLLLIFVLVSCNNGKPFEKRISKVFGEPVFRGLTIGDSYNKVLKLENKEFMQFPDSNIIKYMYHVSDTEEYHWAYIFDEDKIKEIQFDAYLGDPSDGATYVNKLQKRFDKILGPSVTQEGFIKWKTNGVAASLYDESSEALMGKVRMVFYNPLDSISATKTQFKIYRDE